MPRPSIGVGRPTSGARYRRARYDQHRPAKGRFTLEVERKPSALEQQLRERDAQLAVLNEIGDALARQLGFEAIIALVGERIGAILGTPDVTVALYDSKTNLVSFPYAMGDGQPFPSAPIELGPSLTSRIIQTRQPVRTSLADKRLRDAEVEHGRRQAALLDTIERQKEELSRFLSPQIAALVSSAEGQQLLAGHRREATAVFCDLRGFTAFSDSAEPEEVLGMLRDYHAMMGELIVEQGGTLEHFAGDGLMVFFNDPVPQPDHVARAVRMAVAMRERFAPLAARWAKLGFELGLGVGIATGYATLGRIGFEGRYDYGMVGAAVIIASRLSSAAEANQILLNPRAHAAVDELVEIEEVGALSLKGFARPIPTVNVVGLRSPAPVS